MDAAISVLLAIADNSNNISLLGSQAYIASTINLSASHTILHLQKPKASQENQFLAMVTIWLLAGYFLVTFGYFLLFFWLLRTVGYSVQASILCLIIVSFHVL